VEHRFDQILSKFEELTLQMSDEAVIKDPRRYQQVARERKALGETVEVVKQLSDILRTLEDNQEVIDAGDDPELIDLAKAELDGLEEEKGRLEDKLRILLVPKDPNDSKNTIVEIRAGTGGEESALFAADLLRMYTRFIEDKKWKMELMSSNETGMGGLKEVIYLVSGAGAYGTLKYESGVHRVQRVPVTESGGRIHTSAASVVVIPEAEEVDVEIDPNDLRVDVYRSSGPGGQSVNTTDSAVRITHNPTGLVVSCQDEKSQHKNKAKALKVLRARLLDRARREQDEKISQTRKSQVSTGDRSAKIRTYNFPQQRVTDHRIGLTLHRLNEILDGDLGALIDALRLAEVEEKIK
jgi:peptide chain release factor 1